jgi:Rrf2 family protein
MSILSNTCLYGLRAMIYLAAAEKQHKGGFVSVKKIADELDISFHFLTKIFQTMNKDGLVNSCRGPKGGVALGKPAKEIDLLSLVEYIDGHQRFDSCVMGLPTCGDSSPCPLHSKWKENRAQLKNIFEEANLEDLVSSMSSSNIRINASGIISFSDD